jgi:hypothetical protein
MAEATGLSLAACSRIRAEVKVPHPRHREALGKLVGARVSLGQRPDVENMLTSRPLRVREGRL